MEIQLRFPPLIAAATAAAIREASASAEACQAAIARQIPLELERYEARNGALSLQLLQQ